MMKSFGQIGVTYGTRALEALLYGNSKMCAGQPPLLHPVLMPSPTRAGKVLEKSGRASGSFEAAGGGETLGVTPTSGDTTHHFITPGPGQSKNP